MHVDFPVCMSMVKGINSIMYSLVMKYRFKYKKRYRIKHPTKIQSNNKLWTTVFINTKEVQNNPKENPILT